MRHWYCEVESKPPPTTSFYRRSRIEIAIHLSNNSSFLLLLLSPPMKSQSRYCFDHQLSFSNHSISELPSVPVSCTFLTSLSASHPRMLDFKTASTIATSIVHSKLDASITSVPSFSTSNPTN